MRAWRRDGRELFFVDLAGDLISVAMDAGDTLEVSKPGPLFRVVTPLGGDFTRYDVTRDAQRILVNEEEGKALPLVQNWPRLLGQ